MVNTSLYNNIYSKLIKKGGSSLSDINELFYKKKSLLVMTFANLFFQLGLTYYVMEKNTIKNEDEFRKNFGKFILYFLVQLVIIIILGTVSLSSIFKFILFVVFSYTFGLQLTFVKFYSGEELIRFALLGTLSIFAIMFAIGSFMIISGVKLGYKYGLTLFYLLLGLILVRLVTLFMGEVSRISQILSVFSILLFSAYIIYDTNIILQRNYYGDFITASLDYYLDIINIFLNILSLNNN